MSALAQLDAPLEVTPRSDPSDMTPYSQVAIVGVGLLGGSIGRALKERQLAAEVVGIGRSAERLEWATRQGIIDRGDTDFSQAVAPASMIVICTPVDLVADHVVQALQAAPATALVTDVGSTKGAILAEVERQANAKGLDSARFVGSHPLAGDHRSGAEFARGDLLEGRTVVVTPTAVTPAEQQGRVQAFWAALGANVVTMSPQEHDAALAATSHLPHLVAAALAVATPEQVLSLAATGWRDTTRIAAADPALWRQIFSSNRVEVLAALDRFEGDLQLLRSSLAEEDDARLESLLAEGKRRRDAVGN